MMDIENILKRKIKEIVIICLSISCVFSCQKTNHENESIENITEDYINHFSELKVKQRDFMVKIKIDSTDSNYKAIRISTFADLLDEDELPSKIDIYKGMKISYFNKVLSDGNTKKVMLKKLNEKGFYKKERSNFLSNYPEWVVLINRNTGKQIIIKDMWYKPLNSIIEKYRDSLN